MKDIKSLIGTDKVIHCQTQDEWDKILKMSGKYGNGMSSAFWKTYKEQSCLCFGFASRITYGELGFLQYRDYTILPASDFLTEEKTERFKLPTEEQIINTALLFNDGKIEPGVLSNMVGVCQFVIDRLYENGDIMIPTSKEQQDQSATH